MDATSDPLTTDVEFRQVRKGYDPDQVNKFLDDVSTSVRTLQEKLTAANARVADLEGQLAAERSQSPPAGVEHDRESNEKIQRTLVLAERTAEAAVSEAREEATHLVDEGRAQARREAEEARNSRLADIAELDQARDAVRSDLDILQRHVEEQRLALRATLTELERLLDDPEQFRVAPAAGLSGVEVPGTETAAGAVTPPPPEPVAPGPPAGGSAEPDPGPSSGFGGVAEPSAGGAGVASGGPEVGSRGPEVESTGAGPQASPAPPTVEGAGPEAPDDDAPAPGSGSAPTGSDDEFLAELRKAMTDDEPLGPREADEAAQDRETFFGPEDGGRNRSRFGRRR